MILSSLLKTLRRPANNSRRTVPRSGRDRRRRVGAQLTAQIEFLDERILLTAFSDPQELLLSEADLAEIFVPDASSSPVFEANALTAGEDGIAAAVGEGFDFDIDGDGQQNPFQDAVLLFAWMSPGTPDSVFQSFIGSSATRNTPALVKQYLDTNAALFDIDQNGTSNPFQDAVFVFGWMSPGTPDSVLQSFVASNASATRDTVQEVRDYLDGLGTVTPVAAGVASISPTDGESHVSLTRETIVHFTEPVDPSTVSTDSVYLIAKGARIPGTIRVSPTEKFATFFYSTALPESTEVRVVVDGEQIVGRDGQKLDADNDGTAGGMATADFRTLPLTLIPGTRVFGYIYDSYNKNPDGSDIPVVGATVFMDANPNIRAVTDATGFFEMGLQDLNSDGDQDGLPAPEFFVHIDGSTAINAPAGAKYATLGKPFHSVPGQRVQLRMDGAPVDADPQTPGDQFHIYLPPMSMGDIVTLSPTSDTNVGFGPSVLNDARMAELFPNLTAAQRALLSEMQVTYPAGSAMNADGTPATQAMVIPVNPERLPAPLPPGMNPGLVVSIQAGTTAGFNLAGGSTNFDVPAPVTFPNLDGLAPGSQPAIWSFDHDAGMWVAIGTGTVSADGRLIISDPGVGIVAPGWHYVSPPQNWTGGSKPNKPVNVRQEPTVEARLFASGDTDTINLTFTPPPGPGDPSGSHAKGKKQPVKVIKVSVVGHFSSFYDNEGANGIKSETITLRPGDASVSRTATLRTLLDFLSQVNSGKPLDNDRLYAAQVKIEEKSTLADGSTNTTTHYIVPYFYADQADNDGTDKVLKFADVIASGELTSSRKFEFFLNGAPRPVLQFTGDFSRSGGNLQFNPSAAGASLPGTLSVETTVAGRTITATGTIPLGGGGANATVIALNKASAISIAMTNLGRTMADAETLYNGIKAHVETIIGTLGTGASSALTVVDGTVAGGRGITVNWNFADDEFLDMNGDGEIQIADVADINGDGTFGETPGEFIDFNGNGLADPGEFTPGRLLDLNGNGVRDVPGDYIDYNRNGRLDSDLLLGRAFTGVDFKSTEFGSKLVTDKDKYGLAQQRYIFDTLLDQNPLGSFELMLDNILGARSLVDAGVYGGITVAHEAFHTLGMVHSDNMGIGMSDIMNHTNPPARAVTNGGRAGIRAALDLEVSVSELTTTTLRAYRRGYALKGSDPPAFPNTLYSGNPEPTGPLVTLLDSEGEPLYDELDFGNVISDGPQGASRTIEVQIENPGDESLIISSFAFSAATDSFVVTGLAPNTVVAAGGTTSFFVTLDPLTSGLKSASLVLTTNATGPAVPLPDSVPGISDGAGDEFDDGPAPDGKVTLLLSGTGLAAAPVFGIEIAGGNNNLGGVPLGSMVDVSELIVVRNTGGLPLTVTPSVTVGAGDFNLGAAEGTAQTIQPGDSVTFNVSFSPAAAGLRRGILTFNTNDPERTVVVQGLVGTGIPAVEIGDNDYDWGNDYLRIDYSGLETRTQTNAVGDFMIGLPTFTRYDVTVFDPVSGLVASGGGFTGASGAFTDITRSLEFGPSNSPDTDFDGLPDDIESAIGTAINNTDTDSDGVLDSAEIEQGLNPLDGIGFPTGVISSLSLPGEPQSVASVNDLVFVATGTHGLAVVDGSEFDDPILLGQIDLPGTATDVAVDSARNIAAVATGTSLELVDVTDPMVPRVTQSIALNATRVEIANGLAYASAENFIRVFDLSTGTVVQTLFLGVSGEVTGMAREGNMLYAVISGSDTLFTIDISLEGQAAIRGQLAMSFVSEDVGIFAGNDVVWLAGGGLQTVNVSDPAAPVLISGRDTLFQSRRVALNGSGLAVVAPEGGTSLEVYSSADPATTDNFVTRYRLSGTARDVAISRGIAYVAAGDRLEIVNYREFDTRGIAPSSVTLNVDVVDAAPDTPGIQVIEGSPLALTAAVVDDVQVRSVEWLINGQVVETDVAFPFDLTTEAPTVAAGGSSLTIQARAVDTGGNATLSVLQTFTVVPDTFAPTIESVDPADGSSRFEGQRFVRIRFSEAIAENSLSANNFSLVGAGPNGTFGDADDVVIAADLQLRDRDRLVQLTMPSPGLLPGAYRLQINQSAVTDRAGNALGQSVRTETFTVVEFDESADFLPFGTDVSLRRDDSSFAISPMPFAFDFFGEAVSGQMFVTTNGVIEFGADSIGSSYSNTGLPTRSAKVVMPFWDDIDPRQTGTIGLYDADGVRVITFLDIPYYSNTPEKVSFQVAFFSNGQIQMRYGRMDALQRGNATIGISDGTKIAVPALGRIENAPELEITTTDGLLNQAGLDALTADDENDLLVFTPDGSGQYTIVRNPGRTAVIASALGRLPEESAIDDLFSEAMLSVL